MAGAGRGATGTGGHEGQNVCLSLGSPALALRSEPEGTVRTSRGAPLAEAAREPGPVNGFLLEEATARAGQGPPVPQNLPHVPEIHALKLTAGLDSDGPRGPEASGPAAHGLAKPTRQKAAANFLAKRIMAFLASWVLGLHHDMRHCPVADKTPARVAHLQEAFSELPAPAVFQSHNLDTTLRHGHPGIPSCQRGDRAPRRVLLMRFKPQQWQARGRTAVGATQQPQTRPHQNPKSVDVTERGKRSCGGDRRLLPPFRIPPRADGPQPTRWALDTGTGVLTPERLFVFIQRRRLTPRLRGRSHRAGRGRRDLLQDLPWGCGPAHTPGSAPHGCLQSSGLQSCGTLTFCHFKASGTITCYSHHGKQM